MNAPGGARRSFAGRGGRLKRIDGAGRRPRRSGAGPPSGAGRGPGRRRGGEATGRRRGDRLSSGRSPPAALIRCRRSSSTVALIRCRHSPSTGARSSLPAPRSPLLAAFGTGAPYGWLPRSPGAEPGSRAVCPLASGMARGTAAAACAPGQLIGHGTDLTRRLPYLLSGIASPTVRASRQFSEKGRSSWRPGTGGESRRPCIAGTAPPRISLPHIDFLPSSRSQERPRNSHPSPRLSGTPGGPGAALFPRPRPPLPGNGSFCVPADGRRSAPTAYAGGHRPCTGVIRRTRCYVLPLDAGPGAHGGAGPCHETPVGHRAMGTTAPIGRSEPPPPLG